MSLYLVVWKNGWQIISPKKSFAVFAATPTEKAEWMAHINKCITDLLANSKLILQHFVLCTLCIVISTVCVLLASPFIQLSTICFDY